MAGRLVVPEHARQKPALSGQTVCIYSGQPVHRGQKQFIVVKRAAPPLGRPNILAPEQGPEAIARGQAPVVKVDIMVKIVVKVDKIVVK